MICFVITDLIWTEISIIIRTALLIECEYNNFVMCCKAFTKLIFLHFLCSNCQIMEKSNEWQLMVHSGILFLSHVLYKNDASL